MTSSRLDIILLGATGYTGTQTTKNLALICNEVNYKNLRWGLAGRSKEKLQKLITELKKTDNVHTSEITTFLCDAKDYNSLVEVTKHAKVLMNATGANTLLSAPIVKACIETRTDYVDISAELFHMLNIYRNYNEKAEGENVLIVPSCGFACIPVTAGLMHLERNFTGVLHNVDCYVYIDIPLRANFPFPGHNNTLIHYGTWESLVHELHNFKRYKTLRKQTFPEIPEEENKKSFFHRSNGRFWYPYPGPEHNVVQESQLYESKRGKTPFQFNIYTTMPYFIHFLILVPIFFLYYLLSSLACFRKLLWKFPKVFTAGLASHEGPSEKMRNDTKYSFTLHGRGRTNESFIKSAPDKTLTVKVSGKDPGYETTAVAFIFAAFAILQERTKMPKGGVIPAPVAFHDTRIVENLQSHGMDISLVK